MKKTNYLLILGIIVLFLFVACQNKQENRNDTFINNPFTFTILKNCIDDFSSIGTVLTADFRCPLWKENIQDPAFCMLRTITYDGLTINTFSFDVASTGTAEYLVSNNAIVLSNGLTVGSTKKEVTKKLGKPFLIKDNQYVWRSSDLHNYLAFTFTNNIVSFIRWHEEKEPSYKGNVVWETSY